MSARAVHLVSFSPCGGTWQVLRALSRDCALPLRIHDVTLPASRSFPLSFPDDGLVIFGFPVYGGRMPRNLEAVFAEIEGHDTPCALVAVYGNRAFEGALLDLHAAARARGFRPVAAVAAIAGHSMAPALAAGRPNEDAADIERLAAFGRRIFAFAEEGLTLEKAPGRLPDWKLPEGLSPFPETDAARCVRCGKCAAFCPTEAIPIRQPETTDTSACIVCNACVKYCPQGARRLGDPKLREYFRPHLAEAAIRKEAEFFCDQDAARC